jgi:uncharacterized membrane protein
MVLELRVPQGASLAELRSSMPLLIGYVLSFFFIGIYWNNHHHLLQAVKHVDGKVLWANLHLLFWLSLVPFGTAWIGHSSFASWPVAVYGAILLFAGLGYYMLVHSLVALHGSESLLATAIGGDRKGKASVVIYALAIPLSFISAWVACALYVLVAVIWLIPDRRIEKTLRSIRE